MNTAAVVLALLAPLLVPPRRWRWWWRTRRFGLAPPRSKQRSSRITRELRAWVMAADRRRCVACGSTSNLQVDHIVPWLLGGLTVRRNVAVLCRSCNSIKSCYWKAPDGRVYYRGCRTPPPQAAWILAHELKARGHWWRWVRAYL
jgi:5-methylcytosine-specific restriction endonuclease McrA